MSYQVLTTLCHDTTTYDILQQPSEYTANAEMYVHVTASTLGVSIGLNLEQVSQIKD